MKKVNLLLAAILLMVGAVNAQYNKTIKGKTFDRIKLDGNIRLYLEQGPEVELDIKARKPHYVDDYSIGVRNNVLYIQVRNNHSGATPKLKIFLKHPQLKGVDVDGLVHVNTTGPIKGEEFKLKGDGLIRGHVDLDVEYLKVDLDGMCFMSISGKADRSVLQLDGLGRINAGDLETIEVSKSAEGLAGIRLQ
ncbi:hypothetical protein FEE95_12400 [Maribacter algarum]|uniref:Putative auto-transporter adhesin head GIN domain-containing protein n=1 Tax=Maribacter algarum (ex Zhang et al. 2020) TaxID=2578118 RepID=A0A5S3PRB6_9FLAO|nr:DUF2807 domain-containing protein [Maribacter algarum]TMM57280.1 hypothetical protein FEE95_12400 [Maribacter algarum]